MRTSLFRLSNRRVDFSPIRINAIQRVDHKADFSQRKSLKLNQYQQHVVTLGWANRYDRGEQLLLKHEQFLENSLRIWNFEYSEMLSLFPSSGNKEKMCRNEISCNKMQKRAYERNELYILISHTDGKEKFCNQFKCLNKFRVFHIVKWNCTSVEKSCNLSTCFFFKILF